MTQPVISGSSMAQAWLHTAAAAVADRLDRAATSFETPLVATVSVAATPKITPTLRLARSRLRGDILKLVNGCLDYLGYPPLAEDSKEIQGLPLLTGDVELHRLKIEAGSVAMVEIEPAILGPVVGWEHESVWENVSSLLGILQGHAYKRVFLFTSAERIASFYTDQLWPSQKGSFERVDAFAMDRLQLLLDADIKRAARALKTWLDLPDVAPSDERVDTGAFGQPADVRESIAEALVQVGEAPLDRILEQTVGKRAAELAGNKPDFADRVRSIVDLGSREKWLGRPVRLAQVARPGDEKLAALARLFASRDDRQRFKDLEKKLEQKGLFTDPAVMRRVYARLGPLEAQVCAVEIERDGIGTGFLIARDLVLTNYHVVGRLFETPALAEELTFRFDYKLNEDGSELHLGRRVKPRLPDWEEDSSPNHPKEKEGEAVDGGLDDFLDYCVIRLAEPVGDQPALDEETGKERRSWIQLDPAIAVERHDPVIILQYAAGGELKMTSETDGVVAIRNEGCRVLYRTDSLPGSSGSPCFTWDLKLFALHHVGDPTFVGFGPDGVQQGVPIAKIHARLTRPGLDLLPEIGGDADAG